MHHQLSPLPLCALVCPRVCRCLCTVARQMAHRLVPRGRGGGVGLKPIRHASVAWRRVIAQPPEWACLSQPKRWRGGMRTSAACTCTAVCVRERVRARRRSRAAVAVEAARPRPSVARARRARVARSAPPIDLAQLVLEGYRVAPASFAQLVLVYGQKILCQKLLRLKRQPEGSV